MLEAEATHIIFCDEECARVLLRNSRCRVWTIVEDGNLGHHCACLVYVHDVLTPFGIVAKGADFAIDDDKEALCLFAGEEEHLSLFELNFGGMLRQTGKLPFTQFPKEDRMFQGRGLFGFHCTSVAILYYDSCHSPRFDRSVNFWA